MLMVGVVDQTVSMVGENASAMCVIDQLREGLEQRLAISKVGERVRELVVGGRKERRKNELPRGSSRTWGRRERIRWGLVAF